MLNAAIFVIFPLCLAMTAFSDMLTMKIPNRVSVILVLSFIVIAPFTGMGLIGFGWHVLAAALVFLGCFTLFALNIMGGGDAKVLAASALWFGYGVDLVVFLGTVGMLGGFLALIVLMIRANQNILLVSPIRIPMHFFQARAGIPYGMAIGLAAFLTYPESELFRAAVERLQ
ncbi:prepilin peptidase CpaA [Hoeflea marina]|uniref:Prepilin peptidase CpaA n=1 Tax=Hoeflea marina TaxID=274592 RepID=A0A317PL55_9HYPH|nr:prepilin peptidase [Hoeflea marina]PWW00405.1 prepilin peptidase CpaA [Hoeflea marina]